MGLSPLIQRQIGEILKGFDNSIPTYEIPGRPIFCRGCYKTLSHSGGDSYCVPCLSRDGEAPRGSFYPAL